jgi:hypothetical protein
MSAGFAGICQAGVIKTLGELGIPVPARSVRDYDLIDGGVEIARSAIDSRGEGVFIVRMGDDQQDFRGIGQR